MKIQYILAIFVCLFLVSGCTTFGINDNRVVENGDKVKVDYWLTVDNEIKDTSGGRDPFEFTVGAGQVIPGFDKAVLGMKIKETKEVTLTGTDAYTTGPLAGKTLDFKITLLEIN
jgi:FKBP-type peptidyl-prolyl cis-trans isomerase (trigger factor)